MEKRTMSHYILISSRDPFTCGTTADFYDLARAFRRDGHAVTLFLVENGVLAARAGARCPSLAETVASGVTVLAEDFSLRQRAIPASDLLSGVTRTGLELVLDGLASGNKVLWH
jgi:hypothetical protein